MSAVKELDATRSCESAVDMDAAIIAASSKPATNAGKSSLASTMKTVFCSPAGSSSSATSIRPKYAMSVTAPSESITQMMATVALFLTIEGFSMDMKRTRICGMPK